MLWFDLEDFQLSSFSGVEPFGFFPFRLDLFGIIVLQHDCLPKQLIIQAPPGMRQAPLQERACEQLCLLGPLRLHITSWSEQLRHLKSLPEAFVAWTDILSPWQKLTLLFHNRINHKCDEIWHRTTVWWSCCKLLNPAYMALYTYVSVQNMVAQSLVLL